MADGDLPTRLPDELGVRSAQEILRLTGLSGLSVQALSVDWQANEVVARVYVLDKAGRKCSDRNGDALTCELRYPAVAR